MGNLRDFSRYFYFLDLISLYALTLGINFTLVHLKEHCARYQEAVLESL